MALIKPDKSLEENENIKLENDEVYFMSAQYQRLTKWSHSMIDRVSTWHNTPAGNIISSSSDVEEFEQKLRNMDISQLKFSSWTRNSKIVDDLQKLLAIFRKFWLFHAP